MQPKDYNGKIVVLYFLMNGEKTDEDRAEITRINGLFEEVKVMLRNGSVSDIGNPEKADLVAGPSIPLAYANYPRVSGSTVGESGDFRPSGEGFTATSDRSEEARQAQADEPTLEQQVGSVSGGWGAPIR